MINKRLIIGQIENFHFSWMNEEFKKYFKEVIVTSNPWLPVMEDDVLLVNACLGSFHDMKCKHKFGILLPGFGFHPYMHPEQFDAMKHMYPKYDAIFCDEAPVGAAVARDGTCKNFHIVPICCNSHVYKKTRVRDKFKRIIQVASCGHEKGRDISRAAMQLMPYEWELYPKETQLYGSIPIGHMVDIFQNADGFLHPSKIGPPPGYWTDAKYTVSLIEAGMSGCIIFWHDIMKHGNSMETVFEVSLNPLEIAERIQEVVGSIDLEKHSQKTSEEFRNKHSIENTVKKKMDIMMQFI